MLDHREVDHVSDCHDDDGRQRRVWDVVEHRGQERQSQQYQSSYTINASSARRPIAHVVVSDDVLGMLECYDSARKKFAQNRKLHKELRHHLKFELLTMTLRRFIDVLANDSLTAWA